MLIFYKKECDQMAQVEFEYRVADPNLGPGTPIPLTVGTPYLVASLKGGAGLTIQASTYNVWLTGIFGILQTSPSTSITVEITRSIGAGAESLIYSQDIDYAPNETDDNHVVSVNHVDVPGAVGSVRYFLYVTVEDGSASLTLPVTFTGQQNTPG